MRIPEIKTHNDDVETEVIHISDVEPLKQSVIEEVNPKLIKRIERVIRGSYEYKELVSFLKDEMNMDHCFILVGVDMNTATIDIHHHPFTLYTITDIVVRKQLEEDESCTAFTVAEEVMMLHYELVIGLIPLTRTVHELYHDGSIDIPVQLVNFNWKEFLTRYNKYFTDEQKKDINHKIDISDKIIEDLKYPILERKYTYLHVDNMSFPKKLDE